jgi:hypothetical protein
MVRIASSRGDQIPPKTIFCLTELFFPFTQDLEAIVLRHIEGEPDAEPNALLGLFCVAHCAEFGYFIKGAPG